MQVGLENTHHISRVIPHPDDQDDVCVCATGHLWGYTGDRGLFQTKDGGKNWQKLTNGLPDDGNVQITQDGGKSWKSLKNNLPAGEVVRVIRQDQKNPHLLFIGTETGIWRFGRILC